MPEPITSRRLTPRGVATAALIGTAIEWYDFFVYATTAIIVFNQLFFPSDSPLTSMLLAFSTLGVGFLARPLGGVLFAHFGDRAGRKKTLVTSLILMGTATVLVGCLPTYDQIGATAAVALVALRFVQGLAVGGEYGGAVLLAVENAPQGKKVLYGSFPQFGSPVGILASAFVISMFQMLPEHDYLSWGWRIPFLLSIILLVVGLVVRAKIDESEEFTRTKESIAATASASRVPVVELLARHWKAVFLGVGITLTAHGAYVTVSFLPAYSTVAYDMPSSIVATTLIFASIGGIATLAAIVGTLDNKDRDRIIARGGLIFAVSTPLLFLATQQFGEIGLIVGVTAGYMAIMPYYASLSSALADLFPVEVKYTGISVCYQISSVLAGGLLPIALSAATRYVESWVPAAVAAATTGAVTLIAGTISRRTHPQSELPAAAPPKTTIEG